MKNLKLATLSAGVLCLCLSLFNMTPAEALQAEPRNEKIEEIECRNAQGQHTGDGNKCVAGAGFCQPNPCPDNNND